MSIGGKEKEFEFAKKVFRKENLTFKGLSQSGQRQMIGEEVTAMRALEDLNAPSVYGVDFGEGSIAMEYFKPAAKGKVATNKQIGKLRTFLEKARKRGVVHQDLLTGQVGKETGLHNVMLTEEGHLGVYDWGMTGGSSTARYGSTAKWQEKLVKVPGSTPENRVQELAAKSYNEEVIDVLKRQKRLSKAGKGPDPTQIASITRTEKAIGTLHSQRARDSLVSSAATLRESQAELSYNAIRGGRRSKSRYTSITGAEMATKAEPLRRK
jgi:tRNA A-37 threonylcarbamoyl transferase component Bud32